MSDTIASNPYIAEKLKRAVDRYGKLDFDKIDKHLIKMFTDPSTGLLDFAKLE